MTARSLYDAGFTALVSVTPPGCELSPQSNIKDSDRGKAPGRKNQYGTYGGYGWRQHVVTEADIAKWDADGNNIGLRAKEFPGFDIDILDEDLAGAIKGIIEAELGETMIRYGRRPKLLLMYRAPEVLYSKRFKFEHELLGETQLVEFLGEGNQYVVSGTHPDTGQPYVLEDPIHALDLMGPDAIPAISKDDVDRTFQRITEYMASQGYECVAGGALAEGKEVDQDDLRAPSVEALADLVAQIPNDLETREEWVRFGHAIKAAGQDDPGLAYQVWAEWCEKWDGGNDPADVEREWGKFKEPYRVGFPWIMDQARYYGINVAEYEFGQAEAAPEGFEPGQSAPKEGGSTDPEVEASLAALRERTGFHANFSEMSLVESFLDAYGENYLRVKELDDHDGIYKWNGKTWEQYSSLMDRVNDYLKLQVLNARELVEDRKKAEAIAERLGKIATLTGVTKLVARSERIRKSIKDLDNHPDLLNTPAGPIDLRTGKLIEPDRELWLTRITPVAPDFTADCPVWRKFISQVMEDDEKMEEYLQVSTGYWLTGRVDEQAFPFFQGAGANGKSKFIEAVQRIMGTGKTGYSSTAPKDLLQVSKVGTRGSSDRAYHLAEYIGRRLVVSNETDTRSLWDEQMIKQITGGDEVNARPPYGRPFSYAPTYKLVVLGNHEPDLRGVSPAMVRRLQIVMWNFVAAGNKRDDKLGEKLMAEYPAILAWMAEGARKWYAHGLPKTVRIKASTEEYLYDQDLVGQWLEECVVVTHDPEHMATSASIHASYKSWIDLRHPGTFVPPATALGRELKPRLVALGAKDTKRYINGKQTRGYQGLHVLSPGEQVGFEAGEFSAEDAPSNVTPLHKPRG